MNLDLDSHWNANAYCPLFYLDPCEQKICNGTNAVCEIVYSTGKPTCACPRGMGGDPMVKCGK